MLRWLYIYFEHYNDFKFLLLWLATKRNQHDKRASISLKTALLILLGFLSLQKSDPKHTRD